MLYRESLILEKNALEDSHNFCDASQSSPTDKNLELIDKYKSCSCSMSRSSLAPSPLILDLTRCCKDSGL